MSENVESVDVEDDQNAHEKAGDNADTSSELSAESYEIVNSEEAHKLENELVNSNSAAQDNSDFYSENKKQFIREYNGIDLVGTSKEKQGIFVML